MTAPPTSTDALPQRVKLAFAPLHKRAFGTAAGIAVGLGLFVITMIEVVRNPTGPSPLTLLNQYFAGYSVSVKGAFIGLLWGLGTGFVMGWFLAFSRNLVMAASIFWGRARADLRANRDFLDHI
jgi:hypothetical protein